jgi:hypothetical protein
MRFSFLLVLALASSSVTAASAADLRIPWSKRRPPVNIECTSNGMGTVSCAPAIVVPPQKIGKTPIGTGALQ